MDNELFELCKDVYERTGLAISKSDKGEVGSYDSRIKYYGVDGFMQDSPFKDSIPQYSSDYLLEKLPVKVVKDERSHWFSLYPLDSQGYWGAGYTDENSPSNLDIYGVWDNTPLKALLKLVIALHDAGELNG